VSDLRVAKERAQKWAMLTSYDATSARIFDFAGLPCLLVGDSAAQAVYGYKSTLPVTMDELIPLARAVASSCQRALVIADMPFGSYQESPQQALRNATRFMKEAQVHGVKLEGGSEYEAHVSLLSSAGIPVMAHLGFTPQSEHTLGGFKIQGRGESQKSKIMLDAQVLEKAGAFACVLELVPNDVSELVTKNLSIPTIGIGAGPHCDAQILVWTDMVGFSPPKEAQTSSATSLKTYGAEDKEREPSSSSPKSTGSFQLQIAKGPKFVKRYAALSEIIYNAVIQYVREVESGDYPAPEHCYQ